MADGVVIGGALAALVPLIVVMTRGSLAMLAHAEQGNSGLWQMIHHERNRVTDLENQLRVSREQVAHRDEVIDALQEESRDLRSELQILRREMQWLRGELGRAQRHDDG